MDIRDKLTTSNLLWFLDLYDLNQIPYEYTVEVRNRLKGLDLIVTAAIKLKDAYSLERKL